ncbi:hypothetical protein [Arsenophonus sp. PmNCSU2021_1]
MKWYPIIKKLSTIMNAFVIYSLGVSGNGIQWLAVHVFWIP